MVSGMLMNDLIYLLCSTRTEVITRHVLASFRVMDVVQSRPQNLSTLGRGRKIWASSSYDITYSY
jgi:hypothetical protein